jgi:hypothetical protein
MSSKNICNWRDISTCLSAGWTEEKKYENGILTLTAINGWRSFMWDIGADNVGKTITFSYEYRVTDSSNAGYLYVQNHVSTAYGSPIQDLSLDTPDWICNKIVVSNANRYIGFNVRGTDNTEKRFTIEVRNIKIAVNNHDAIYTEYNITPDRCADDSGWGNTGFCHQISTSDNRCKGSKSVQFNGNYSYIESPNFKPNLPNEDYTIAFWINPSENGVRDIIYGNHAGSTNSFSIERYTGNELRIYYQGDTPGYVTNAKMLANEWTHIAIVRKNNTIQVWRNGIKILDKAYTLTTLTCSNAKYKIGSDYRTSTGTAEPTRFKGLIDDFRIYITALEE